jgi:predicted RNA-binding protein
MCLSKVYLKKDNGERTLVMSEVSSVRSENGRVTLSDIIGQETSVPGTIAYADLVGGVLEIRERSAVAVL